MFLHMLLQLPTEISTVVQSYLPNRDIKSLRLSCKALFAISQLRFDRVFLSANPRNIEVFRAIADHPVFRERVVEIIWDDARLQDGPISRRSADPRSPNFDPEYDEDFDLVSEDEDNDEDSIGDDGTPYWFVKACVLNLLDMRAHKCCDVDRPDHVAREKLAADISFSHSWNYYQSLLRQQNEVLETNADYKAFNYGLLRFPALRRVTISPAAHGSLFRPLYETPMIRAFPPSFDYPIPRTWPLKKRAQKPWKWTPENEKDQWRSFRLVTRSLAVVAKVRQDEQLQQKKQRRGVTELIVDVNQLLTGLNPYIFAKECDEQRDLVKAIGQPNFRRLDLVLGVGGLDQDGWRPFRSGYLRRMLEAAPDLEHISLRTDEAHRNYHAIPAGYYHLIPLRNIFPIEAWTRLKHFGLARFAVDQNDLLSFLGALPPTLRSVELSFLFFSDGNHRDLLVGMRNQLGWRERPADQRPRVSIVITSTVEQPWRGVWADAPVEQFLYHDGPNPFGADGKNPNRIPFGCGAVVKDAFDPAYERPCVDREELQKLGYTKTCVR